MAEDAMEPTRARLEAIYRADSRRILATLIRLLGDFELAEDALHDAFRAALERPGNTTLNTFDSLSLIVLSRGHIGQYDKRPNNDRKPTERFGTCRTHPGGRPRRLQPYCGSVSDADLLAGLQPDWQSWPK